MADSSVDERPQPPGEVLNEKFSAFVKFASTSITRAKQVIVLSIYLFLFIYLLVYS